MALTKKTTALTLSAGVLALGAGLGVTSLAAADPTASPSPSSSPSASTTAAPPTAKAGERAADGRHRAGPYGQQVAKKLADKLGVPKDKVREALRAAREEIKPAPGAARPDRATREAAMAKALASKLGVSEARVKTALTEIRSAVDARQAAALKPKLDAAVKAGTLTRAEADAVTKAVRQGVVNVGRR